MPIFQPIEGVICSVCSRESMVVPIDFADDPISGDQIERQAGPPCCGRGCRRAVIAPATDMPA